MNFITNLFKQNAAGAKRTPEPPRGSADNYLVVLAYRGDLANVQMLLSQGGADVNDNRNPDGTTPLMAASFEGHRDVIRVLLAKGANVRAKNNDGLTALMAAAQNGHREIVETLLSKEADRNATDTRGTTALMLASANGHVEVVESLLGVRWKKEASINHKRNDTLTALMMASMNGHPRVVKVLIDGGADVKAETKHGDTALSLAQSDEIKALLKGL